MWSYCILVIFTPPRHVYIPSSLSSALAMESGSKLKDWVEMLLEHKEKQRETWKNASGIELIYKQIEWCCGSTGLSWKQRYICVISDCCGQIISQSVSPGQFSTLMRRHGIEEILHPLTDSHQAVTALLFLLVALHLLSSFLCTPDVLCLSGGIGGLTTNIRSPTTPLLQHTLHVLGCDIQPAVTWT